MPKFLKWIILIIVIAAIGAGIWWWKGEKDDDISYVTAPAAKASLTQAVTATGTLNPVLNVQVGSQISGNIKELFADYNSPVKAMQVVAQIDPATFQATVKQAEGELANAKAALELAQINERRARELLKRNAAPQSALDTAIAALHQAQANIVIREGSLQRATVDLARCTIVSPVDGIVISRNVDVGQTVAASMSAPVIFQIANDLTKMQIDANVAEADVGKVEVDQNVEFTVDAFPYRTFRGKVVQVRNAPLTVQNVVTYDTVISVNNDDLKLKPGMTANVSIIIAQRENALTIKNAALRFRPPETQGSPAPSPSPGSSAAPKSRPPRGPRNERTIYVQRRPEADPEPVQIKVGITDGIATEVTEGLNEGDQVVLSANSERKASSTTANPFGGGMPRRF